MKIMVITAALVLASYCIGVGILAWQQRRYLYFPQSHRPDVTATGVAEARALTVHTKDGLDLLAWWVPPSSETQPVVLYLHGNGGHIGYRAHRFARLNTFGWGVLLLEYRGFGGNPGRPTEAGLTRDAQAAYATLRARGTPAHRIILWGESLGTGIAVRLAAEQQVGAVLLESPYTSLLAIGQQRFPYVPVAWLLLDRFDLIGRIAAVHAPLLVMTGGRDTVVPPAMRQAVFNAANEPKMFWLAPEAGHNDLTEAGAFDAVHSFVSKYWTAAP